jgi:hypothetical protein
MPGSQGAWKTTAPSGQHLFIVVPPTVLQKATLASHLLVYSFPTTHEIDLRPHVDKEAEIVVNAFI